MVPLPSETQILMCLRNQAFSYVQFDKIIDFDI